MLWILTTLAVVVSALTVRAADITWVGGGGVYETNSNWSPAIVPGPADRAVFNDGSSSTNLYTVTLTTNEAVANVLFGANTNSVVWKGGDANQNQWKISNALTLDEGTAPKAVADFVSGVITVTNASGNGLVAIGNSADSGPGLFEMELASAGLAGPVLVADQLTIATNADFTLRAGSLTTVHGSTINRGSTTLGFYIGTNTQSTSGPVNWDILGGSNTINFAWNTSSSALGTYIAYGSGTVAQVTVSGSNTVWSPGGNALMIGHSGNGTLIVSNGAQVICPRVIISRATPNSYNNVIKVTGPGSFWYVNASGYEDPVGWSGTTYGNQISVLNGGRVMVDGADDLTLGSADGSYQNTVTVSGSNSFLTVTGGFVIGEQGSNNSLVVSAGGVVTSSVGSVVSGLGNDNADAVGNTATIDGKGSSWVVANGGLNAGFNIGRRSVGNTMIVTNGGSFVLNGGGLSGGGGSLAGGGGSLTLGDTTSCSNNFLKVSGGAVLVNAGTLNVGNHGFFNTLLVENGGTVTVTDGALYLSPQVDSGSNTMILSGGNVMVTNSAGDARFNVGYGSTGTLTFNGGTITTDRLLVRFSTNGVYGSTFTFNSGVLNIKASNTNNYTEIDTGVPLVVGDGVDAATLNLLNGGLFSQHAGLTITNNATLQGKGFLSGGGIVTICSGAALSPGDPGSIGTLTNVNELVLSSGSILNYDLGLTTGDQLVVYGNLTLNGTLNINDAGGFGVGTYTLIVYTNQLFGGGLSVGTTPNPSLTYTINTNTIGLIQLVVASAPSNPFVTWQQHYFNSTNSSPSQPNADPYGKGISNTNQFLAGFNPTNSASYPHIIQVQAVGSDVKVTYLGASGDTSYSGGPSSRTNVLEFTTGTANGSYTNNFVTTGQTNLLSGGSGLGTVTNMVDSGGATNRPSRFYRVRVVVP